MLSCQNEKMTIQELAELDYDNQVTHIEFVGEYSATDAIQFLGFVGVNNKVETTSGFSLYRYQYKTHNYEDTEIVVSGLMGLPQTNNIKGLVSWQHGTNTFREGSLSSPSADEGIGLSALFAGNEFAFIASDYIGLGTSYEIHPYYHMESTTNAVIDFIKIGETVLNHLTDDKNNALFLTGFSQGGGAPLATQRALEISNPTNLQLKATASIAGAFNLREISLGHSIHHHVLNSLVYLGYLSNAYSKIYNQPLASFIKEPYATNIPNWFDGSKDYGFLENNLPARVTDLFLDEFYTALDANETNWFTTALDENEMYQWQPDNSLRLYYGANDLDVIPQEAISAHEYMSSIGGNVELKPLGPFNHEQSIVEALPLIQQWFNSL